jgi:hypothetical protein
MFKLAAICSLIVTLSACAQTAPRPSTSTHGSDHTRQIMYHCASTTMDNATYTACLLRERVAI